jgi:hypothetical protein
MPNFDSSKPSNFIMYYDVTNLYGYTMSGNLPYDDFEWVDPSTVNVVDLFETIDGRNSCLM